MAWWSDKLSLGGLQDIAGAVNKISESVKNIEKNFDSALGLEEKRDDEEGIVHAATVAHTLLQFSSRTSPLYPGCIAAWC
jgi:hypothetical protein